MTCMVAMLFKVDFGSFFILFKYFKIGTTEKKTENMKNVLLRALNTKKYNDDKGDFRKKKTLTKNVISRVNCTF